MALGLGLGLASVAAAQTDGAFHWPAPFTTLSTVTAGDIISSPAVGPDGTVYIGVQVGRSTSPTASGRVFAINPNGSLKWQETLPDWVDSSPAVGDGVVYIGCWDGKLYARRAADGAALWSVQAGAFIASSPAIGADGTIYVGADSNLVAITPDGSIKWLFPAGDWIDSSPAIGPDGTIYVGSWDNALYAVRPDGTQKWRYMTGGDIASSPAIAADGTVYVGSRDTRIHAVDPHGALKWSAPLGDTLEASPVLGPDGTVYVATAGGRVFALDSGGGEYWRYPRAGEPALNAIYSTPAVRADGSIVFGSSNNAVYAVSDDGTLRWRTAIGDWSDSSPVVTADGVIYIGCADKRVYALTSTVAPSRTDWPQFRRDARRTGWQPMGSVAGTSGRLGNLAVRTFAGAGDDALIVGFVVGGGGARSLLVRGVGPTLANFGITGVLENPRIVARAQQAVVAENEDWDQSPDPGAIETAAVAVGAFPLPRGSRDSALLADFPARDYTVQVSGAGGTTGVALMETYDAAGASTARLINVSARSAVGTGSGILIAGFVVQQGTRAVLVRAVGPGLQVFGVPGVLADPLLQVFRQSEAVAENDDWSDAVNSAEIAAAAQAVGAFPLPAGSWDAALLLTLPPGPYTAQVSGVNGATGVALVEIYEVR
jgi:outer membrane protein assembly factor BamB